VKQLTKKQLQKVAGGFYGDDLNSYYADYVGKKVLYVNIYWTIIDFNYNDINNKTNGFTVTLKSTQDYTITHINQDVFNNIKNTAC